MGSTEEEAGPHASLGSEDFYDYGRQRKWNLNISPCRPLSNPKSQLTGILSPVSLWTGTRASRAI